MNPSANGRIKAVVPRGLIDVACDVADRWVPSADGLVAAEVRWADGLLTAIAPLEQGSAPPRRLLLPRLVDPHVHLDKVFTWPQAPNREGTYTGALAANLQEHHARTEASVAERAERALQLAHRQGLRAIRSHIDSLGPGADCSWTALLEARRRWQGRIAVQLVALVPIAHWMTPEGEALGRRVAEAGGLLGGVLVPPCGGWATRQALLRLLQLADQLGCGVDLHIDEAQTGPAEGMLTLLEVLDRHPVSVPITCSHASSLALLPQRRLQSVIRRMAQHQLQVVALPLTNGWLLGRQPGRSPVLRPLAPILQLQRGGVRVAVGGDNVQDPWYPGGNFDPLMLMSQSLSLAQLAPWDRLGLMPFTTEAARVMGLGWDGVLRVGAPADLLLIEASHWTEVLAQPPCREVVVAGVVQPH